MVKLEFGFSVLEVNLNQPTILELMQFFTLPDVPPLSSRPDTASVHTAASAHAAALSLTPTRSAADGGLIARASLAHVFSPSPEGDPWRKPPGTAPELHLPPAKGSAPALRGVPGSPLHGRPLVQEYPLDAMGTPEAAAGVFGGATEPRVFAVRDGDARGAGYDAGGGGGPGVAGGGANDAQTPARPSRFSFTASMDSLVVCLHDAGVSIARVALQNSEVTVETAGPGIEVTGRLGNLCIKDVWSQEQERAAAADPEAPAGSREVFGLRSSEDASLVHFEMTVEPNKSGRRRGNGSGRGGRNRGTMPPVESVCTLLVRMQSVKCIVGAPFLVRLMRFFTETPLFQAQPADDGTFAVVCCSLPCMAAAHFPALYRFAVRAPCVVVSREGQGQVVDTQGVVHGA